MITVIARLKVKPGSEPQFEEAAREMISYVTAKEPGTQKYIVHRAAGDPSDYVFYEVYADEASFAAHGASEQMAKFFGTAGSLLAGRPEITMYEEIAGKR